MSINLGYDHVKHLLDAKPTFLKQKNIDLVYFVGPSQYSLYLDDTKFFMTVPDVSVR